MSRRRRSELEDRALLLIMLLGNPLLILIIIVSLDVSSSFNDNEATNLIKMADRRDYVGNDTSCLTISEIG